MQGTAGRRPWMLTELAGPDGAGTPTPYRSRIAAIGYQQAGGMLSSRELVDGAAHHPNIDLERLTGIHERHVVAAGEDSLTLAVGAARDCLEHAETSGAEVEMLVSCSITRYRDGLTQRFEPPLSLAIKDAIGAPGALSFDITNACAGTLTGIFIINDFIRRGVIKCGMAVSGEYISGLARGAARDVRHVLSSQLASLTLGDAGVAVLLRQAPEGAGALELAAFTTLADHSRLCLAYPAPGRPGAIMYTKARKLQGAAIRDVPRLLEEGLNQIGIDLDEVDYLVPHQTSSRAIRKGREAIQKHLGADTRHMVDNLEEYGNTASTTHFVALHRYLEEGRFKEGDRVVLLALASGLEVGVVSFTMDEMVERYGSRH